jgi:hypothetical protein
MFNCSQDNCSCCRGSGSVNCSISCYKCCGTGFSCARKCVVCSGGKTIACCTCLGKGAYIFLENGKRNTVQCHDCLGEKAVKCPLCCGEGLGLCAGCSGKKKLSIPIPCPKCQGCGQTVKIIHTV